MRLRTRNSPSASSGTAASRIAKSSAHGMPFGRDFSQTWRLMLVDVFALILREGLVGMDMVVVVRVPQETQRVAGQQLRAHLVAEPQFVEPLQRIQFLDQEGVIGSYAELGRPEDVNQVPQRWPVVDKRVVVQSPRLLPWRAALLQAQVFPAGHQARQRHREPAGAVAECDAQARVAVENSAGDE